MSIEIESGHITPADGNVFADLGFAPEEAAALKATSQRIIAEKLIQKRQQPLEQAGTTTDSN